MNIPLLDSEKEDIQFDWTKYSRAWLYPDSDLNTILEKINDLGVDDLEANQSQNSHQSSVEGEDDSSSEQEDFDNGSNGDSDVEFGYGEGDQLVEQQHSGEELTLKDQIMQRMQNVVQMQKSNDMQAALQYIEEAFHLMNYNTPSHWPTQYPEFFDDFGNLAMQNNQPTVAFTYYCIALDAPDSSGAEKSYEQIVNKVDEIDNHQLQEVYEQRKVLSEYIQQQGFNWTNAIVNAYPEHIYNTCAIEGNRLGLEEVTNLMKTGIPSAEAVQMTGNHDVTEIIGAYNAYAYLFTDMDGQTLSVKQILSMHKIILENMPKGDFAGVFKNTMCISSEDYEAIMEEFVAWFQQADDHAIDAISLAAMTHLFW
uniref:Uncharacterized protein n=1 Tax=Ditylenchus dipsaci TaxID=166011 RepID=A0A915CYI3_9BILA